MAVTPETVNENQRNTIRILSDDTNFGLINNSIFKSDEFYIGDLQPLGLPENSLYFSQKTNIDKDLIDLPEEFSKDDIIGISLINTKTQKIPLNDSDIEEKFGQYPNLKIIHIEGYILDQSAIESLSKMNLEALAYIKTEEFNISILACSNIKNIFIEETIFELSDKSEIEKCRDIFK